MDTLAFQEVALYYGMDPDQALAYQLCLVWLENSRKLFPDYQHYRMPKKGDPRKSMLFKYCYKLVRETKGLIPDDEYQIYIWAQLVMLKAITDGKEHPLVDPQILVGDKAWVRWRIYKKKFDQKKKVLDGDAVVQVSQVAEALERTKAFLFKHFQGQPTFEDMQEALDNKNLLRWAADKRLSPYYLANSKNIYKLFPNGLNINLDLDVYRTPEALAAYEEVFAYEL
jgi:hypothetical protein